MKPQKRLWLTSLAIHLVFVASAWVLLPSPSYVTLDFQVEPIVVPPQREQKKENPLTSFSALKTGLIKTIHKDFQAPHLETLKSTTPTNPGATDSDLQNYLAEILKQIRTRLEQSQHYRSGTVTVRLVISRSGSLLSKQVVSSTGDPSVKEGILSSIAEASPFSPFKGSLQSRRQLSFIVPIEIQD